TGTPSISSPQCCDDAPRAPRIVSVRRLSLVMALQAASAVRFRVDRTRAVRVLRRAADAVVTPEEAFEYANAFRVGVVVIPPVQIRRELLALAELITMAKAARVVEIGTAGGGTFFVLTRCATPDARLVTVDLAPSTRPRSPLIRAMGRPGQ